MEAKFLTVGGRSYNMKRDKIRMKLEIRGVG